MPLLNGSVVPGYVFFFLFPPPLHPPLSSFFLLISLSRLPASIIWQLWVECNTRVFCRCVSSGVSNLLDSPPLPQHGRVKVRTTAEQDALKAKEQEAKLQAFLKLRGKILANVSVVLYCYCFNPFFVLFFLAPSYFKVILIYRPAIPLAVRCVSSQITL